MVRKKTEVEATKVGGRIERDRLNVLKQIGAAEIDFDKMTPAEVKYLMTKLDEKDND